MFGSFLTFWSPKDRAFHTRKILAHTTIQRKNTTFDAYRVHVKQKDCWIVKHKKGFYVEVPEKVSRNLEIVLSELTKKRYSFTEQGKE